MVLHVFLRLTELNKKKKRAEPQSRGGGEGGGAGGGGCGECLKSYIEMEMKGVTRATRKKVCGCLCK